MTTGRWASTVCAAVEAAVSSLPAWALPPHGAEIKTENLSTLLRVEWALLHSEPSHCNEAASYYSRLCPSGRTLADHSRRSRPVSNLPIFCDLGPQRPISTLLELQLDCRDHLVRSSRTDHGLGGIWPLPKRSDAGLWRCHRMGGQ